MPTDDVIQKRKQEEFNKMKAEIERLQRIIDSRPAINAGLPETYIEWSQSICLMEVEHSFGTDD